MLPITSTLPRVCNGGGGGRGSGRGVESTGNVVGLSNLLLSKVDRGDFLWWWSESRESLRFFGGVAGTQGSRTFWTGFGVSLMTSVGSDAVATTGGTAEGGGGAGGAAGGTDTFDDTNWLLVSKGISALVAEAALLQVLSWAFAKPRTLRLVAVDKRS